MSCHWHHHVGMSRTEENFPVTAVDRSKNNDDDNLASSPISFFLILGNYISVPFLVRPQVWSLLTAVVALQCGEVHMA